MDFMVKYDDLPFSIKTNSDKQAYRDFLVDIGTLVVKSIVTGQKFVMRMVSTTLDMMMTSSKSASRPLLMAANLW